MVVHAARQKHANGIVRPHANAVQEIGRLVDAGKQVRIRPPYRRIIGIGGPQKC